MTADGAMPSQRLVIRPAEEHRTAHTEREEEALCTLETWICALCSPFAQMTIEDVANQRGELHGRRWATLYSAEQWYRRFSAPTRPISRQERFEGANLLFAAAECGFDHGHARVVAVLEGLTSEDPNEPATSIYFA